jgi:hypothetical protein
VNEVNAPNPPDTSWIPATTLPEVSHHYETLNSLDGTRAILLRSRSGGWWNGAEQWPSVVTHWRELK